MGVQRRRFWKGRLGAQSGQPRRCTPTQSSPIEEEGFSWPSRRPVQRRALTLTGKPLTMNAPVSPDQTNKKAELLAKTVEHMDITAFDARPVIDYMRKMSFTSRDTARAADILTMAYEDKGCSVWVTLAGSTSAAGCMHVYRDMAANKMLDCVVATGASIVDMDFFEALGFKHYQAQSNVDDRDLRDLYIDRIYDTYIDEEELQNCDHTIKEIVDGLEPRPYSSREFIHEMGKWLANGGAKKPGSLIQTAFEHGVPIFCPAFTDSSAGFGLVKHQVERIKAKQPYVTIDAVADFRELTDVKMAAGTTGLFMVGGGVPKNFAQDTVVCAEILGQEAEMHKYAVQITVADVRDGACSSSTLKEACSWGKVDTTFEQMVFAEATTVVPLIASDAYHRGAWRDREERRWADLFKKG
jgi:deoxyhypusine synthase